MKRVKKCNIYIKTKIGVIFMTKIAIAYHSGYGRTKVQAEYILKGLKEVKGVETYFIDVTTIDDKGWKQLDDSNAIIFGSPTYMGSVSAKFKEFMEVTGKIWLKQGWKDKFAAGFTNSGSIAGDKFSVLLELAVLAAQHGMVWIPLGLMPDYSKPAGDALAINRSGTSLGATAQSDNTAKEPAKGDLETARLFGKRLAEFVVKHKG